MLVFFETFINHNSVSDEGAINLNLMYLYLFILITEIVILFFKSQWYRVNHKG